MNEDIGTGPPPFASLADHTATDTNTQRQNFQNFEQLANSRLPPLLETLEEYWTDIPLPDSWLSHTLVVRPKPVVVDSFAQYPRITTSRTPKRPLMVYFHGGSFITGSPLQLVHPARLIAQSFNATVICPSYRLAPEHPWPSATRDCLELVQAISSQPHLYQGANPSHGFVLAGVSVGANMAAVVAGLTSSDPAQYPLLRPLTGLYLAVPILLTEQMIPQEYREIWTSRIDNRQSRYPDVDTITKQIGCTEADLTSPWFSPINILGGERPTSIRYPPIYLQAGGLDPVRDDAVVFQRILTAHEVPTKLDVFSEDGHDALSSFNLVFPPRSKSPTIEEGTLDGILWLFRIGQSTRT